MVFVKHSSIDQVPNILFITFCEEKHSFGISFGCAPQSFSVLILTYAFQYRLDSLLQSLDPFLSFFRSRFETFPCPDTYIYQLVKSLSRMGSSLGQLNPSKSTGGFKVYGLCGRSDSWLSIGPGLRMFDSSLSSLGSLGF